MKRILSLLILSVLLLSLVSCGGGRSLSIGRLRYENEVRSLFMRNSALASLTETVEYFDAEGGLTFSYELVYERAEDIYAGFNIAERIGDYTLYTYEGSVFTEDENGLCAVLLIPTYQEYISSYLEGKFPFDGESLRQKFSRTEGENTVVRYASVPTPQMAAKLLEFGVSAGETILSDYTVDEGGFIHAISYFAANDGGERLLARRRFEKSAGQRVGCFNSVSSLAPSVAVDILYVGEEKSGRHFTVPAGVRVGIEQGKSEYAFFLDEALTKPYSYLDGVISEDMVIYAKKIK